MCWEEKEWEKRVAVGAQAFADRRAREIQTTTGSPAPIARLPCTGYHAVGYMLLCRRIWRVVVFCTQ